VRRVAVAVAVVALVVGYLLVFSGPNVQHGGLVPRLRGGVCDDVAYDQQCPKVIENGANGGLDGVTACDQNGRNCVTYGQSVEP
jgi:hypothetical protein